MRAERASRAMSWIGPLVGVLTFAMIVGGTLYLLAAYERIVSRPPPEKDAPTPDRDGDDDEAG